MEIEVTIKAVLTLPDGTKLPENGRKFTLPDGSWVKPWLILESNDSHGGSRGEARRPHGALVWLTSTGSSR